MKPIVLIFAVSAEALPTQPMGLVEIGSSTVRPLVWKASIVRLGLGFCLRLHTRVPPVAPLFESLHVGGVAGAMDPNGGLFSREQGVSFEFRTAAHEQEWETEVFLGTREDFLLCRQRDGNILIGVVLTTLALCPERTASAEQMLQLRPDFIAWRDFVAASASGDSASGGAASGPPTACGVGWDPVAAGGAAMSGAAMSGAAMSGATNPFGAPHGGTWVAAAHPTPVARRPDTPEHGDTPAPRSPSASSPRENDRVEGALLVLAAAIRRRDPEELASILCRLTNLTAQAMNALSESRQCVVCMGAAATHVSPCGAHRVCCGACCAKLEFCPMCRAPSSERQ